ncbi:MAG: potassium-transporting ATPase subunit KdpB [Deltaproteobacteria bacterium]|nr:potassium-transporting ATPase subunit KdpB [Deltaproteobacteria bacterium]
MSHTKTQKAWNPDLVQQAILDAFKKLDPRVMVKNPVMFIVEIGSLLTSIAFFHSLFSIHDLHLANFNGQISLWLWFTVLFANFAEAIAEGRGKAQADSLRKTRTDTLAFRQTAEGKVEQISSSKLRKGDVVVVEQGQIIPADGEVIEGTALVNEAVITGESAPVIREAGGDRSAVTGGTTVLSDKIIICISTNPGESFLDRMIALVEGAVRKKTPNEIALSIMISGMTIIFLLAVVTLQPFAIYSKATVSAVILISLLVCLIPTTIGGLLSAIGIAGMDRLVQRNVLAMSGRAVEASGDIDILLLDKTGTITIGNRMATEFIPVPKIDLEELAGAALLSSYADQTPEGRSIVDLAIKLGAKMKPLESAQSVPFTAETRMSGIDFGGNSIRKGAVDAVQNWVKAQKGEVPIEAIRAVERISIDGGTPLLVAKDGQVLGVIHLKDIVKPGIRDRFERIRAMGIKSIMITGDNKLTAKAIAKEAGVDDFVAEAKPEEKLGIIKAFQSEGRMVGMSGDGTNDAPALAQADVGLVMNTGTQAAREAGNMVDLDSDPTKIIEIVEIGKQLLITRGSLTTFSVANDVAKYFAILPAIFMIAYPSLAILNVMNLATPESAILSAVIFNALIIVLLIPLALRGVKYRPSSVAAILKRNLLIYGLGGIVIPFVGIKIIDLIISGFGII